MPEGLEASGLADTVSAARGALSCVPAGIVTDFDGTLSPIVSEPDAARPLPGVATALEALARRMAVVAVVTGRGALDARERLGAAGALVVGNHGIEWLYPHQPRPEPAFGQAAVEERLRAALSRVVEEAGVKVEYKGMSATIHYRGARDPAAARTRLMDALSGATRDLELREGRASIELRPLGLGDKGEALRRIVQLHRLRGLMVLGDDVTDLDMFRAAAELRAAGTLSCALIGAVQGGDEVPAAVQAAADLLIGSVEDAAQLLRELATPASLPGTGLPA